MTDDLEKLHSRLQALRRHIDYLVIDGVPRRNHKATAAMLALLHARGLADDLYRTLMSQMTAVQLARLAYMDAAYGCNVH